eukprot:363758-Chlamydomonas_euryale.AAC.3
MLRVESGAAQAAGALASVHTPPRPHAFPLARREWCTSQAELRKQLGQLAQSIRDHAVVAPTDGGGGGGGGDRGTHMWQEDEELVEQV